ncbi:hypothetical protein [Dactylosporangium sp. CA-139066]|uniref:hypothetical protein n=1 Tax=Dactylosporangium sp. CA-139066 TaxID=3239930 RepID=UPI003D908758
MRDTRAHLVERRVLAKCSLDQVGGLLQRNPAVGRGSGPSDLRRLAVGLPGDLQPGLFGDRDELGEPLLVGQRRLEGEHRLQRPQMIGFTSSNRRSAQCSKTRFR